MIDTARAFLHAQLDNDILIAVVFGAILALLRRLPSRAWDLLQRHVVTTVDIADDDPAFFWVQKWLSDQEYTRKRTRLLTVSTREKPSSDPDVTASKSREDPARDIEVTFSPAPGYHFMRFKGSWLLLYRARREVDHQGSSAHRETFTFQAFSRDVVRDLIYEARDVTFPPEEATVGVYIPSGWGWLLTQKKAPRDMSTVVLADGIAETIESDLDEFIHGEQWYRSRCVPYQRGYLLTGPPGSGKTTLVLALASKFRRGIYTISLARQTDDSFFELMTRVPASGIVLIEDVDCSYTSRESTSPIGLSFSAFINGLDGLAAPHGRVLFMTTNHPEKLDPALKREGRADCIVDLGYATQGQARRIYLIFFPGEDVHADTFAAHVGERGNVSMAALQGHLLTNRSDCAAAARFQGRNEGETMRLVGERV